MSPKVTRIIFVTKSLVFMRFSSIFINLLDFFRITNISVKTQSILTCWGCFEILRPQDEQISKLSLDGATFEGDIEVFQCCRCWWPPLHIETSSLASASTQDNCQKLCCIWYNWNISKQAYERGHRVRISCDV